MKEHSVGMLPVFDGGALVGIVTDRDIVVRAIAVGKSPATIVADVMTPRKAYVFEDQDAKEAQRVMQENSVRRVIVLDRNQKLVGVVSEADFSRNALSGIDDSRRSTSDGRSANLDVPRSVIAPSDS